MSLLEDSCPCELTGQPCVNPCSGCKCLASEPRSGDKVQPQAENPDDESRWDSEGGHIGLGARPFRRVGYVRLDR